MSDYIELNGEKFRCAPEIADALIKTSERIAKLEAESAQWQESCGQNYVRATEAEMREAKLDDLLINAHKDGYAQGLEDAAKTCEAEAEKWVSSHWAELFKAHAAVIRALKEGGE